MPSPRDGFPLSLFSSHVICDVVIPSSPAPHFIMTMATRLRNAAIVAFSLSPSLSAAFALNPRLAELDLASPAFEAARAIVTAGPSPGSLGLRLGERAGPPV